MSSKALRLGLAAMFVLGVFVGLKSVSTAQSADCPTENFIDVSGGSAGAGYATPELSVTCNGDRMVVHSNGIISYEFVSITPNALTEQNNNFTVPLNPQVATESAAIPLLGPVAVAVNGMPIYGPNEAPRDDYGDPFLDQILDYCNGHTGPRGDYHYHARPDCLFTDMEGNTSLVIAYSFDGFPILAPYICLDNGCTQVKKVQSSWQRTQDVKNAWEAHEYVAGSGDLDECNGTYVNGSYRYYATDTFPYFMGCYRGVFYDDQEPATDTPSATPGATETPEPTPVTTEEPSADAPSAPSNINVSLHFGQPIITWDDDSSAEWFYIYIGDSAYTHAVVDQWVSRSTACTTTCEFRPDIYLSNGVYHIWLRAWGAGKFSTGGSTGYPGWSSKDFTVSQPNPGAVQAMTATIQGHNVSFQWQHQENASWYHIWAGTGSPQWRTLFTGWVFAEDANCNQQSTCTLSQTNNVVALSGDLTFRTGSYVWYIESWGPGGFSSGGIPGAETWTQGNSFTIS